MGWGGERNAAEKVKATQSGRELAAPGAWERARGGAMGRGWESLRPGLQGGSSRHVRDKLNTNAFTIPKWRYFEGHGTNRA